MNRINVGVLTISDRCARGEATDESGPVLVDMIRAGLVKNGTVTSTHLVPDCREDIEKVLKLWCDVDNIDLILTTGGTGLSDRDVTPEATEAVLDKKVPGIPLLMFNRSSAVTPLAALSRAVAGVRGRSLIINLPGSKKASRECLEAVAAVIPHAVDIVKDRKREVEGVHIELNRKKSSVSGERVFDNSRQSPYPCIDVADAQKIVLDRVLILKKRKTVEFEQAFNYVLAQDVVARDSHPPFDASLRDGYAVRSDDKTLSKVLIGVCDMGEYAANVSVNPGTCMKISTGGYIPPGADAVVEVENTVLDKSETRKVRLLQSLSKGQNIRRKGSDFEKGEVLMAQGTCLNAAGVGLLAAAGITSVEVFGKPVVAVMSTGNELSDPREPFKLGKVRDSNRITLMAMLKDEGYETVDLGISRDDADLLRDSLERGFREADVVVTTGSMSMGERDLLKEVIMADFGGVICFGRVLMKPGKPTSFGVVTFEGQPKLWFGLPGNPASAVVCSELFLLPGLRRISGHEKVFPMKLTTIFDDCLPPSEERPQYLRGIVDLSKGPFRSSLAGNQCSSCIGSCAKANCLLYYLSESEFRSSGKKEMSALVLGKPYI